MRAGWASTRCKITHQGLLHTSPREGRRRYEYCKDLLQSCSRTLFYLWRLAELLAELHAPLHFESPSLDV